jgi:hypothetical protein
MAKLSPLAVLSSISFFSSSCFFIIASLCSFCICARISWGVFGWPFLPTAAALAAVVVARSRAFFESCSRAAFRCTAA